MAAIILDGLLLSISYTMFCVLLLLKLAGMASPSWGLVFSPLLIIGVRGAMYICAAAGELVKVLFDID